MTDVVQIKNIAARFTKTTTSLARQVSGEDLLYILKAIYLNWLKKNWAVSLPQPFIGGSEVRGGRVVRVEKNPEYHFSNVPTLRESTF